MIYLKLFWDFFRVSCFTFGGAYGAIPLIRDMVLGNGWLTDERLTYMIAVSESTPGPIMVNMATYIGSDQAGFWGSVVATVGVVLPAYLVILLIVAGGAIWLYNAYRLGRLPWKPKGPANAKLVCAVILLGIILVPALAVLLT